jgi:hypothetical protein
MTTRSCHFQRAIAKFPRGGTSGPWTYKHAYEMDVERLREGPVADDALKFTPTKPALVAS